MVTVLTRTIGPSGRDYASFTLAEADVTNIGTSADLVANDEAIVFEADAATYNESVTFSSTLTTDATRQVTYKPASGAEHGGVFGQGVVLFGNTKINDDFGSFVGIGIGSAATSYVYVQCLGIGLLFDQILWDTQGTSTCINFGGNSIGAPVRVQNCVSRGNSLSWYSMPQTVGAVSGNHVSVEYINCTGTGQVRSGWAHFGVWHPQPATVKYVNCIAVGVEGAWKDEGGAGALTVSGSNNFGISGIYAFPAAIQGTPATITPTTSFSTPLGSGDYAVYMGATGALADVTGNDVWQQGVGPASNSDVPTTDINGVTRSGTSCNPGAFEADGFVAPTVLTRTIGSGKDYATPGLAEADVPNIGSGLDRTFYNEAVVFEIDAGTYGQLEVFNSTLTYDQTRNTTYRAAAGSEHQGQQATGVVIEGSSTAACYLRDPFAILEGVNINNPSGVYALWMQAEGVIARSCVITGAQRGALIYQSGTSNYPCTLENCAAYAGTGHAYLTLDSRPTGQSYGRTVNCTAVSHGNDALRVQAQSGAVVSHECVNMLVLSNGAAVQALGLSGGTATLTGSNNFGGATNPFPAAIQGSPYPITPSTAYDPGAGDFALYVGKNGALLDSPNNDVIDQGVGPSANSDVPTTDILGNARSGATANPGAFEQPQATATITKTIGPSGRDYTTFTLAEADVTNIGGSADLVNENERIVFEADAGTYTGPIVFSSTLVTDATRNVTYKPAAGSEHGGVPRGGVYIYNDSAGTGAVYIIDKYTKFEGIEAECRTGASGRACFYVSFSEGQAFENCIASDLVGNSNSGFVVARTTGQTGAVMIENCVSHNCLSAFAQSNVGDMVVLNSTAIGAVRGVYQSGGTASNWTLINSLILGGTSTLTDTGSGTTFTGSNNFGGATNPFPVAIQGTPYPITATTAPEQPQIGDFAIHDSNGRLYNITTNDVWQAGIGPASDSDVPTTDILGATRSGTTANPGAFELGVGESNDPPALPGLTNATPDFRVHLDRRVTDATTGVSSTYDASTNTTTFTLPYKLNTAATMQVVTRKTSGTNAGQSLTVVSTDATNRRVVVSGNHTGTAVFIGEKYTMKYEFSELHLQRNKNTYAAEPITAASHRVRYGRVNYGQTSFFKVTVTPKGGTSSTYVFNGNLLNEPETQLGSVALYDGHFQFPVLADHDRVTIELENDSPLPSRFLSCEWESFYHSRIGSRSRY